MTNSRCREQGSESGLSPLGKANPRLVCYGTRRELSDLQLDGRFREPFIAPAHSFRLSPWVFIPAVAVMAFVTGGIEISQPAKAMLEGSFCLLVASAFLLVPRNLYYRVSPQRLDVLRRRAWKSLPVCQKSLSLDRAMIVCHFEEQKLYVGQQDSPDGKPYAIDLRRLTEPHAFVKAVFEAAIAPQPAPRLPDDALLG